MSTKTSKRKQKRVNTNDEEIEISDKSISPEKIDDPFKDDISEHSTSTENEKNDNTEEQNGHKLEENGNQNGNHEKNGFNDEKLNDSQNHENIIQLNEIDEQDMHLSIEVTPEKQEEEKPREKSPVLTGMTTRSHKSPKVDKTENGLDTKLTDDVQVVLTPIEDKDKVLETPEDKPTTAEETIQSTNEETKVEEVNYLFC